MTRFAPLILASLFVAELAMATTIKVRITQSPQDISVTGLNLRFKAGSESFGASNIRPVAMKSPVSSFTLKPELAGGLVRWLLVDKDSGSIVRRMTGDKLELSGEMIRLGIKPAPNSLVLKAAFEGIRPRVDVVANLDLEDYLKGVLPHEMPPEWPLEALKAQAIASRTYALTKIRQRERARKLWHVESTVMDQVYNWLIPTAKENAKQQAVRLALEETKGEVLNDESGRMVSAYFHADCGGATEEATEVWGPQERKLGTAKDLGCPFSPQARWSQKLTADEIYSKLRGYLKLAWPGQIKDLSIKSLTSSGRVATVAVLTGDGNAHIISGAQFRSLVGFDRLRSTKFEIVRKENGQFDFNGRGHGHGVGLCQWGARKLAVAGMNYRDILRHYYPKTTLAYVD